MPVVFRLLYEKHKDSFPGLSKLAHVLQTTCIIIEVKTSDSGGEYLNDFLEYQQKTDPLCQL